MCYIYFYSLSSFPHLVCLVIWETVGRPWCKIILGDPHVIDTLWYTGCTVQAAWNQRLKLVRSKHGTVVEDDTQYYWKVAVSTDMSISWKLNRKMMEGYLHFPNDTSHFFQFPIYFTYELFLAFRSLVTRAAMKNVLAKKVDIINILDNELIKCWETASLN